MKFKIGSQGNILTLKAIDELSLKDMLRLELETESLGRKITMADIEVIQQRIDKLTDEKQIAKDPDATLLFAIAVWATRRNAGEDLGFGDAIDFPIKDLHVLPDPKDNKPPARPTQDRPRKGSGPAAKPRRGASARTATSARRSTPGSS